VISAAFIRPDVRKRQLDGAMLAFETVLEGAQRLATVGATHRVAPVSCSVRRDGWTDLSEPAEAVRLYEASSPVPRGKLLTRPALREQPLGERRLGVRPLPRVVTHASVLGIDRMPARFTQRGDSIA